MLALIFIVCVGFIVTVALVSVVVWIWRTDWLYVICEAPAYVMAAVRAEAGNVAQSCVMITAGGAGTFVIGRFDLTGTFWTLTFVACFGAVVLGAMFLAASFCDFVLHLLSGDAYREAGLEKVYEQRIHDTGGYAQPQSVDAALRGTGSPSTRRIPMFED